MKIITILFLACLSSAAIAFEEIGSKPTEFETIVNTANGWTMYHFPTYNGLPFLALYSLTSFDTHLNQQELKIQLRRFCNFVGKNTPGAIQIKYIHAKYASVWVIDYGNLIEKLFWNYSDPSSITSNIGIIQLASCKD